MKHALCNCVRCGAGLYLGAPKTAIVYHALTGRENGIQKSTSYVPTVYLCEKCTKKLDEWIRRG